MIFFTLQGPNHTLEVHDDKLRLIKRGWWVVMSLSFKDRILDYKLTDLSEFKITTPKVITGKLEWSTFEGAKGAFRFGTNSTKMIMIEKYVHTLVAKNIIRREPYVLPVAKPTLTLVAAPMQAVEVKAPQVITQMHAPALGTAPIKIKTYTNHKVLNFNKKKHRKKSKKLAHFAA